MGMLLGAAIVCGCVHVENNAMMSGVYLMPFKTHITCSVSYSAFMWGMMPHTC